MSANDREIIEHWNLRDNLLFGTGILIGLLMLLGLLFISILLCSWKVGTVLLAIASIVLLLAAFVTWKLIRIYRRIEALERFIP